jgi:hypothetical protein
VKLKKVQVAGECAAARCKARVQEEQGGLCAKHAGAEAADIAPGDALALELEPQRTSAEKALALLASAPLDTQAQLDWLGAARGEVTRQLDALEQRRTSVTKPLNEAKRQVDALFRPVRETLEACKRCINDRLLQHATAARAAQDAALAQVELGARDAHVVWKACGEAREGLGEGFC